MITIPISKIQLPISREVFADIFWVEDGERKSAAVSIFYFTMTAAAVIERKKQLKPEVKIDENGMVKFAEFCASQIEKIPAFGETELTQEFFESLDLDNLTAIYSAIVNDMRPKSTPSPLPDTSKPTDGKEVSATSAKKSS